MKTILTATIVALTAVAHTAAGQGSSPAATSAPSAGAAAAAVADYTIGIGDVLNVNFWHEAELSGEVVVRPDGKISLPLIKEVVAAGLRPQQLEAELETLAKRFVQEPTATVTIRTINSRLVYITGNVPRAGSFPLNGPMTVLQLIAQAGGILEYADAEHVVVMRTQGGTPQTFKFDYKAIVKQKKLEQNIELRPGDTVIVP